MKQIKPPFSKLEVLSLKLFQTRSSLKPFTCKSHSDFVLNASPDGLSCAECDYVKNWVWDFMINWQWIEFSRAIDSFLDGDHNAYQLVKEL